MKNKLIAFVALALTAVLISGCTTTTADTTAETPKKDRKKSSMYAR